MITITFEWAVEVVADVARRYFGAEQYEWVNNWSQEDIDDFTQRMRSVMNENLNHKFERMVERYIDEEFVPEENENDSDDESDWAFGEDKNKGL